MKQRKLFAGVFVGVVAAMMAAYALWPRSALEGATFVTLSGDSVKLRDLRGKVVLVNFWATTCPACVKEMPELVQIYQRYRVHGFEIVAVAMAYDPPEAVKAFVQRHALPFPVTLDPEQNIANAFGGVEVVPTTYIIDKDGRVQSRTVGLIAAAKVSAYLDTALGKIGREE